MHTRMLHSVCGATTARARVDHSPRRITSDALQVGNALWAIASGPLRAIERHAAAHVNILMVRMRCHGHLQDLKFCTIASNRSNVDMHGRLAHHSYGPSHY
jgi:hypothetical protein